MSDDAKPPALTPRKEWFTLVIGAFAAVVEVDTMHLAPLPRVERRQFTAVDFISRYGLLEVRRSSQCASRSMLGHLGHGRGGGQAWELASSPSRLGRCCPLSPSRRRLTDRAGSVG